MENVTTSSKINNKYSFLLSQLYNLQVICSSSLSLSVFFSNHLSHSFPLAYSGSGPIRALFSRWGEVFVQAAFSVEKLCSFECVSIVIYPCKVTSFQLPFLSFCELFLHDVQVHRLRLLIVKCDPSLCLCTKCQV